ncbi:MAG: hypothetical protein ACW99A_02660, partial [Candidatus Kariarchaeaceae archaeon]|jgi:hypothetical protein
MSKYSGQDLNAFLSQLTSNMQKSEIERSDLRNNTTIFKNLLICSRITNSVIGTALRESIHHIISISRFNSNEVQFHKNDIMEILYKNEIFITSLGEGWIFNTPIGKKIVNIVLCNSDATLWNLNLNYENLFIGLKYPLIIDDVFMRLRNCIFYYPTKNITNNNLVSTILLLSEASNQISLSEIPDLIISLKLTSKLITYCYHQKIILAYVHSDILFSEVARDLSHILTNELKIQTTLCSFQQYRYVIK